MEIQHTWVENSFYKLLYEQIHMSLGIPVYLDLTTEDFSDDTAWVILDTLSCSQGPQPRQNYYLHCAQHRNDMNGRRVLNDTVDKVCDVINKGVVFPIYNPVDMSQVGVATVIKTGLSPAYTRPTGGSMRSLSVSIVFPGV